MRGAHFKFMFPMVEKQKGMSDWIKSTLELFFMTRLGDTFEFLEVAATSGRLQLKDGSIDPEEARRVVDNPALGCLLNQRLFTSTSVFVPGKEVDADTKAVLDGQKRGGDGSFEVQSGSRFLKYRVEDKDGGLLIARSPGEAPPDAGGGEDDAADAVDAVDALFQTHVVRSPVSLHVAEMESVGASSLEPGALVPSGFSVFRLQERRQGGVEFTKFDIFFASALAALILLALIFTLF